MNQQTEFCELPYFWQKTIRDLRRECANSRIENRGLREDIEGLRIALAALGGGQ